MNPPHHPLPWPESTPGRAAGQTKGGGPTAPRPPSPDSGRDFAALLLLDGARVAGLGGAGVFRRTGVAGLGRAGVLGGTRVFGRTGIASPLGGAARHRSRHHGRRSQGCNSDHRQQFSHHNEVSSNQIHFRPSPTRQVIGSSVQENGSKMQISLFTCCHVYVRGSLGAAVPLGPPAFKRHAGFRARGAGAGAADLARPHGAMPGLPRPKTGA